MNRVLRDAARILGRELTEIVRDQRALVAGLLLPLLLYPLLIFGMQKAQEEARRELGERVFRYVVLRDPRLLGPVRNELGRGQAVKHARPFRALLAGNIQVLVDDRDPRALVLYFDGSREDSAAAVGNLRDALDELAKRERAAWVEKAELDADPRDLVATTTTDLSSGRSDSQLPLYAPFVLLLAVLGGASMAALDAIAGERERGTIETLLVQPVSRTAIALGKLGAVVAMAVIATLGNLVAIGVMALVVPQVNLQGLTLGSTLLLLVLSLPLAALLSAILLAVTSYARSYREAQGYHYPVMLLAFVPGALPLMPGIKLDPVMAWVPVGNVCLAISEVLRGTGDLSAHMLTLLATTLYAGTALAVTVRLLASEEILSGTRSVEEEDRVLARKAVSFALLAMLLVYYAGTLMQARALVPGLLLTLYGLILLPALGFARLYRIDVRRAFHLTIPSPDAMVGATIAAIAVAHPVMLLLRVQSTFLPMPEGVEQGFAELLALPLVAQIFCLAVSPGICEEAMFRGLLLPLLRRGFGTWRGLLLSSLLFGAFHLNFHRLLPTTIVGFGLGLILVRTSSLLPCMLAHATYNGYLALGGDIADAVTSTWWGVPASLLLLLFAARLLRPAAGQAVETAAGTSQRTNVSVSG